MKSGILQLVILAFSFTAFSAENSNTTSTGNVGTWLSNTINVGGYKSYNTFARMREGDDAAGRRLKSKNEFFLGAKSAAGWGAQIQAVEYVKLNGPKGFNAAIPGDPSLTVFHPMVKNDNVTMTGAFRAYLPVADASVASNVWQFAYYWTSIVPLKNKMEFNHILVPRYFAASKYKDTDTTFYVEDVAGLAYNAAPWLRLGVAEHTQVEFHAKTATGFVADVYPFADLMLSKKVFMGPRVYFPVAVSGSVYDSARAVSMNEVQAELYLQATL